MQLWTTTGVGTWRLAHCPGDRHGRLGAIRTLSALIFACESRIPAGNPWTAPHTVARLIGQVERVTGVRVKV